MEDLLIGQLAGAAPIVGDIVKWLGTLVVVGQAIVWATPSKSDDAFLVKMENVPVLGGLLKGLKAFAPYQKKGK